MKMIFKPDTIDHPDEFIRVFTPSMGGEDEFIPDAVVEDVPDVAEICVEEQPTIETEEFFPAPEPIDENKDKMPGQLKDELNTLLDALESGPSSRDPVIHVVAAIATDDQVEAIFDDYDLKTCVSSNVLTSEKSTDRDVRIMAQLHARFFCDMDLSLTNKRFYATLRGRDYFIPMYEIYRQDGVIVYKDPYDEVDVDGTVFSTAEEEEVAPEPEPEETSSIPEPNPTLEETTPVLVAAPDVSFTRMWKALQWYIKNRLSEDMSAIGSSLYKFKDMTLQQFTRAYYNYMYGSAVGNTIEGAKTFLKGLIDLVLTYIGNSYRSLMDSISSIIFQHFEQYIAPHIKEIKEYLILFFMATVNVLSFTVSEEYTNLVHVSVLVTNVSLMFLNESKIVKGAAVVLSVFQGLSFFIGKDNKVFRPQALTDSDKKLVKDCGSKLVYVTVLGWCAIRGLELPSDAKSITDMLARHGHLGRAMQTWNVLSDHIVEMFEKATEVVFRFVLKKPYASSSTLAIIDELHAEVLPLLQLDGQMKIGRDYETSLKIEKIYHQYIYLRQTFHSDKNAMRSLDAIAIPIYNMYDAVVQKNPKIHKMRAEPVVIMLTGKTGVGKTAMLYNLQIDLLKIAGKWNPAIGVAGLIYSRNSEQEYWDGYSGQPICIVDEFMQRIDSINSPNIEIFELIRAANIFPYTLHSASLHDKANSFFSSQFMVLTTNATTLLTPSIVSNEALQRRIHVAYTVHVRPEVEKGGVDKPWRLDPLRLKKYREDNNLPSTDMSHYIFKDDRDRVYTYEEFVIAISKEYESHQIQYEQMSGAAEERTFDKLPTGAFSTDDRWRCQALPSGQDPDYNNVEYKITLGEFVVMKRDLQTMYLKLGGRVYRDKLPYVRMLESMENIAAQSMFDTQLGDKRSEVTRQELVAFMRLERAPSASEWFHKHNQVEVEDEVVHEEDEPPFADWEAYAAIHPYNKSYMCKDFNEVLRRFYYGWPGEKPDLHFPRQMTQEEKDYWCMYHYFWVRRFQNRNFLKKMFFTSWYQFDEHHNTYWRHVKPLIAYVAVAAGAYGVVKFMTRKRFHKSKRERLVSRAIIHWVAGWMLPTSPVLAIFSLAEIVHWIRTLKDKKTCDDDCIGCSKIDAYVEAFEGKVTDYSTMNAWVANVLQSGFDEEQCLQLLKKFAQQDPDEFEAYFSGKRPWGSIKLYTFMSENAIKLYPSVFDYEPKGKPIEEVLSQDETMKAEESGDAPESGKKRRQYESEQPLEITSEESGDEPESGKERNTYEGLDPTIQLMFSEGYTSKSANDLRVLMRRNMYVVHIFRKDQMEEGDEGKISKKIGTVTILKGHKALINEHYLVSMRQFMARNGPEHKYYVLFTKGNMHSGSSYPITELIASARRVKRGAHDTELFIFTTPMSLSNGRDVTKHLIKVKELSKLDKGMRMLLLTMEQDAEKRTVEIIRDGTFHQITDIELEDLYEARKVHRYADTLTYAMSSQPGDCGSPLIVASDQLSRQLVGFHIGGSQGYGCCSIVCFEDVIEHVRNEFEEAAPTLMKTHGDDLPEEMWDAGFVPLGTIDNPPFMNTKTRIVPSEIYGQVVETKVVPAVMKPPLTPGGPLIRGIMKHAGESMSLETHHLHQAMMSYSKKILALPVGPHERKILSYEDACRGVEGNGYFPPLKRSTSAGWPLSLMTKKGKRDFLGDDEWDFTSDMAIELRKQVNEMEDQCRRGIVPEVYYVDTLKDEKLPIEKVKAGKCRVFSAAPLAFTVLFRKYNLGFLAFMMRNRNANECSVGTNPYSSEWGDIRRYMMRFGDKSLIAGDFSNFDGSVNFYIMNEIVRLVNNFYSDDPATQRIRTLLWENITKSKHIFAHFVYQLAHSQPSGNPATAVSNSMYNSIATRYCYSLIMGEAISFNDNVNMVAYGDDNIIAVSKTIQDKFNPLTLTQAFKTFGMTYTSEMKDVQTSAFRSINEVQYLKRHFVFDEDLAFTYAPLSLQSILEMTNWVKKDLALVAATQANCEHAINELYFHDKDTFLKWSLKINQALASNGLDVIFTWNYDNARSLIATNGFARLNPKAADMRWAFDAPATVQGNPSTCSSESIDNAIFEKHNIPNENIDRTLRLSPYKAISKRLLSQPNPPDSQHTLYLSHEEYSSSNEKNTDRTLRDFSVQGSKQTFAPQMDNIDDVIVKGEATNSLMDGGNVSLVDTTGFALDGEVHQKEFQESTETAALCATACSGDNNHSAEAILAREVHIETFMMGSQFERKWFAASDILEHHASFALARNKLTGFYGMTADVKLRITITAQPFQSGIFYLYHLPRSAVPPSASLMIPNNSEEMLPFATGCNGVYVNIANQSGCELTVPYVNVTPFVDLVSKTRVVDFGVFFLLPIIPVTDATSKSEVQISTYLSFQNAKLYGATMNRFTPQGKNNPTQMTRGKQQEERSKEIDWAGMAEKAIPLILAALSRPNEPSNAPRRSVAPFGNMAVSDSTDVSFKMTLTQEQNVKMSQLGVTKEDEMDIANYVQLPGYLNSFTFATEDKPASLLYYTQVEPQATISTVLSESKKYLVFPNRLRYAANLFQYWRGSINYTFRVAATKFHSGMIRVSYGLGDIPNYPCNQNYTWVHDLRDGCEFTINVPYMSPTPWRLVPHTFDGFSYQYFAVNDHGYETRNYLSIHVENPLLANTQVAQKITIAVFVSGGPDIEFAGPMNSPSLPTSKTTNWFNSEASLPKFKPQSADAIDITTGGPTNHSATEMPSDLTIGERITNFRVLLRRYSSLGSMVLDPPKDLPYVIHMWPDAIVPVGLPYDGVADHATDYNSDYLTYLSYIYCFRRGGMRMMLTPSSDIWRVVASYTPNNHGYFPLGIIAQGGPQKVMVEVDALPKPTDGQIASGKDYIANSMCQVFDNALQGSVSMEIPYNSRTDKAMVMHMATLDTSSHVAFQELGIIQDGVVRISVEKNPAVDTLSFSIYRATADDFSFGYAIGPPPTLANCWLPGLIGRDNTVTPKTH